MNKIIFYISISINILLILLFYIIYYYGNGKSCTDYPIYNKILVSNIVNECKSGDLLLFSNLRCNVITRTLGNPYFSHIGIIVKKLDELYVLELVLNDYVYPKQSKKANLIFTPLIDRIKNYSGYVFYCKLLNNLSLENENKLLDISNENNKFTILNNCGYFIGKLIEDLNIAQNITSCKFWTIHNNIINLCNNIIYSSPIQLISDELLLNNINNNKLLNFC
jgi:hypothetical protein